MFEKFGDYMFYLLNAPLKKGRKKSNQFYIFLKVIGKLFDATKRDIFRVRDESMVISASPVMLPVHGQDKQMARLKGEDIEAYRTRLSMKAIIAEKAGSEEGILLALAALGYEQSYLEPMWKQSPEHWAEFIIFLRGKNPSSVNDLRLIDAEVMKVKQASSKPFYGAAVGNHILISSQQRSGMMKFPLCNTLRCGVYPEFANVAHLIKGEAQVLTNEHGALTDYPIVGRAVASTKTYEAYEYTEYHEHDSTVEMQGETRKGRTVYPICGTEYSQGGNKD